MIALLKGYAMHYPASENALLSLQEEERERIEDLVTKEESLWSSRVIDDESRGLELGELNVVPDEGENWSLIRRLKIRLEPKSCNKDALALLAKIDSMLDVYSTGPRVKFSVTSLYRSPILQKILVEMSPLSSRGFSSHTAGAAIDFDPNGYYENGAARGRTHPAYDPGMTSKLEQVLNDLEKIGVCTLIRERKHVLSPEGMYSYVACWHVCSVPSG